VGATPYGEQSGGGWGGAEDCGRRGGRRRRISGLLWKFFNEWRSYLQNYVCTAASLNSGQREYFEYKKHIISRHFGFSLTDLCSKETSWRGERSNKWVGATPVGLWAVLARLVNSKRLLTRDGDGCCSSGARVGEKQGTGGGRWPSVTTTVEQDDDKGDDKTAAGRARRGQVWEGGRMGWGAAVARLPWRDLASKKNQAI
jgi:hypothetical protein